MYKSLFKTTIARPINSAFRVIQVILIVLMQLGGAIQGVQPVLAAGGAYTLNFAAADPSIYIPPIPFPGDLTAPTGAADGDILIPLAEFNDGTSNVRVESLAPQDMALGQIVPFEVKITTSGDTTPENGVITFVVGWNTLTTNGDDFGYDARNDDVGYGVIGAFIDIGDGAHFDPANDATVDSFTWSLINDEIVGIFTVSGLDSGDVVVLEPWLVLDDTIGPGVGGNVQSRLIDAATGSDQTINVANSGAITLVNGDSISTGNQTVPLLKPSDFFNAEVDVSITKTDDPDPVTQGETLSYLITASNAGPAVANTVVVYDVLDPNVTFVSASDGGFLNTDAGDSIPDGAVQWNVGALAPGDAVVFTVTVTVNLDAPTDSPTGEDLINSVTVTTISDDTNPDNNTDTEPTDVLSAFVPAPSLSLLKQISTSASGPWSSSINVTSGDTVYYQFTINNTGNVALSPVSVNDPDVSTASCTFIDPLPVGGTTTCVVGPITALEGTHTNTAIASGGYGGQTYSSEPSSATYIAAAQVFPPDITLTKTADPASIDEPGGNVTFTILVVNNSTSDATLDSLNDSVYGDLNGEGNCSVPQPLAGNGGSYSCSFTAFVSGNTGDVHTNVATAVASNAGGSDTASDDATVTINDVPSAIEILKTANPISVDEPGGNVTFTFVINNLSAVDSVTIDNLTDTIYGDLNTQGDCSVPQTIAAGGSYSCAFTAFVDATETNIVTASGLDDDGNPVSDDDDATVTIKDVPSSIEVIKTANPTSVDEPGGDVTFTFTVNNTSAVDSVTINSLSDSIYGDLNGQGDCAVPQTIAAGGSYSCSITKFVSGQADDIITNVLTVAGADDDGNPVDGTDDATVTINDVPSSILTTKTANPASVPETGGDVTFTIAVENTSAVDTVTINSVIDSVYGDVSASCAPALPVDLLPGESVTCSFTEFISGDYPGSHVNVATASGLDDDGNPVSDDDEETVPFEDVLPDISITKSASPTSVPETGGDVTFTFVATNNSTEATTLDSLVDSVFGNLDTKGDCTVPQPLAANGGSYSCSITVTLSADDLADHYNVVTATASDDDGNTDEATDDETVTFTDVAPEIRLTKSASPTSVSETGGDVTFTFTVDNIGQEDVTLTSLTDTVFNDLNGQGDCVLPQDILIGGSYSCSITVNLSADDLADHYNVATATAVDDDGTEAEDSDDETVTLEDVLPDISITKTANPTSVPETGGTVTFTFLVTNNSLEAATLDSLVDSDFGDLNGQGNCSVPQALADNGGTYSCSITVFLSGDASGLAHNNVVTATASDNDGNSDEATDDETVTFEDVLPDIAITKTANPTSVYEPGGDVEFTIMVTNNSLEDATIDSLVDSDFDLVVHCAGAAGTVLSNGESYTCVFTEFIAGNVGEDHQNTATVVASDNDDNSDTESDSADVTIDNVTPAVSITKDGPASINEGGDSATYDITISNNSVSTDPLTISSLNDDKFGDLLAEAEAARGGTIVLASGESFTFQITRSLEFNVGDTHTNVVTVVGVDDEGTEATDNDDHTVAFDNVAPVIAVTKTADQLQVFAPGEDVLFTIRVENNSVSTDPITLNSLADDVFGDLTSECVLPQTIGPGGAFECDIVRAITADHTNTVIATAVDDEGTEVSDSDDATVDMINPSIDIEKSTNGFDADAAPGPEILSGASVTWEYLVTNDGDVDLSNIIVADSVLGDVCIIDFLAAGDSTSCTMSGTAAAGQYANIGSASVIYTDADGDLAARSDSDDSHYFGAAPAVDIEKSTNSFDADAAPGPEILAGAGIEWVFEVTNTGNVDLTGIVVTDSVIGTICTVDLAAGASTTCSASGTAAADQYENLGTADFSYTDDSGNSTTGSADDPSHYFGATPSVDIVKTFADESVIAGGAGSSFTLAVTNDGNVTLDNVLVLDTVDSRLQVSGVSATSGADADSDADAQTVEWLISTLDVGESVTITVEFSVASSVPEALAVNNTATVSDTYTDDSGNSTDLGDEDSDAIDILVDINLSIVKTFDPSSVPQGTAQSFTLVVTNNGPSDAVDVSVTDIVHSSLAVSGVSVTSGTGDCLSSAGQNVACTLQISAGQSVTITVNYVTAPFLRSNPSPYGTQAGDDFRFVFVNGSVLEGSTDGGPVYLDGVEITNQVTILSSLTRNDLIFDPPGPDPAFEMHLSCSDPFTGGWGQSAGPVEGVDTNWQIAFFSIARYNSRGFFKSCGNVVNEFDVPNTANATGEDSFGTESVSDDATVTVTAGIKLDRLQTNGKRLTARLTNFTGENKEIVDISIVWPASNGNLSKVWLTQDGTSWVIWSGSTAPPTGLLGPSVSGWNGATLLTGEGILRFDFKNKSANSGYTIRVNFTDGTFLDISVGDAATSSVTASTNTTTGKGKKGR